MEQGFSALRNLLYICIQNFWSMSFIKKVGQFFISRKLWINVALIALAWVVIIWGTLKYFDSYTNHGEEINVPVLLGNNLEDVPRLLSGLDLRYEIIDSLYNPSLLEGTIVYQSPMPTDSTGMSVKEGRVIKVRVSKQTRLVDLPIVVSKSRRFAETVLMTKGLRTKTTFVPSNEDQGSVVEQKYKGKKVEKGMKIPINSIIELVVGQKTADEYTYVPDLNGLTINEVQQRLSGAGGLRLFVIYNDCNSSQDSLVARVVNQTPVPGDSSRVPAGSTITVFASPKSQAD
jgi:eukaryotic-like serine/threonine-protein kinase